MVWKKRALDLVVCLLAFVFVMPLLALCAVALRICNGRPVFYVSERRVYKRDSIGIIKFRTMVRDAAAIANRDTMPVVGQRFLNIPLSSPLYTRVGRFFERFQLTELPQLIHVLRGQMSLVGSRPLPENVIRSLAEEYPHAEDRFIARCGLTGPVQLVGRDLLSDEERLRLEIAYCQMATVAYSIRLDLAILLYTVLLSLRLMKGRSVEDVENMIIRYSAGAAAGRGHDVPSLSRSRAAMPASRPVANQPADVRIGD